MNTEKEMKMVYTTNKQHQIGIIKALLNDNNIECHVINKMDSSYLFGDIEMYVNEEDYDIAKKIVAEASL